jgi:hypothetical protein
VTLATGGTISNITVNNVNYIVHTFTTSGTLTVTTGGEVDYLVVAGGGGGAGYGGGGAGGYRTGATFITTDTYSIVIGAGGVGRAGTTDSSSNGNNSVFSTITSIGGGNGGSGAGIAGLGGGSGGGGSFGSVAGGAGTEGQGFAGGTGGPGASVFSAGGGGGASEAGQIGQAQIGGVGGAGASSAISGTSQLYAGGGGGGHFAGSGSNAAGGAGGGGTGGKNGTGRTAGAANTGGGGGGHGSTNLAGEAGGSGIVIIRYIDATSQLEYTFETLSFNAGGQGGIGGPNAGGGGGAGGYIPAADAAVTDSDPIRNLDVLAIKANSDNLSTNDTFIDSSINEFSFTRAGNITQGSFTPHKPGSWSSYIPASNSMTINSASVFDFGTSDFTVECWVYPANTATSQFIDARPNSTNGSFFTIGYSTTAIDLYVDGNTRIAGTIYPILGQWNHIAVTRTSGTTRMFVNGAQSGSNFIDSTNYGSATNPRINSNAFIGVSGAALYVASMRVVKGTSLYSAAFTPLSVKVEPISGTALLILQENRFIDQSTNNISITVSSAVTVSAFSPFLPEENYDPNTHGGSAFFDGNGDQITRAAFSELSLNTGDWTWEGWAWPTRLAANQTLLSIGSGGSVVNYTLTVGAANGTLLLGIGTGGWGFATSYTSSTNAVNLGQWNHFAFVRSGTTLLMYANGVNVLTQASANFGGGVSGTLHIGSYYNNYNGDGSWWGGYLSGFRLVKGTALYTANFTPPTTPPEPITNTALLLNFTNASIYDETSSNNIETLNGAQVSASVVKHGTGSMFFDGVDDYLLMPNNPNLILAGGAWTVDCWINPSGNYSIYRTIFSKRASGTSTTSYQGYLRLTSGVLSFFNGTNYESTVTPPANQWSHCAWVYTGTNIQIYLNGVQVLNSAATITEINESVTIGGLRGLNEFFAGYIDDFRITKGVARYSDTFDLPEEIYPQIGDPFVPLVGNGAAGDQLQAGQDNNLGGGAGGGSGTLVAGGGGGVGLDGFTLSIIDQSNAATGGTKSFTVDPVTGLEYVVHTFTSSDAFSVSANTLEVEYLVVAGGGGAAGSFGGGGGAGGYRSSVAGESSGGNSPAEPNLNVVGGLYTVTVGAGGAAGNAALADPRGTNGSDSSFSSITSLGGGTSGSYKSFTTYSLGIAGGSGGGGGSSESAVSYAGGAGTAGQGFAGGSGLGQQGYLGGGGGGAGAVGQNAIANSKAGNGGTGISSLINGTPTIRAGGGGGAAYNYQNGTTDGVGGAGGGGAGRSNVSSATGISGTANTGGGGGGGGYISGIGGAGGSGIVIVRYKKLDTDIIVATGGAVATGGSGGSAGADSVNGNGGLYGGGGAGTTNSTVDTNVGNGAGGALKIIFPGIRSYPSPGQLPNTVTNIQLEEMQEISFEIQQIPNTVDYAVVSVNHREDQSATENTANNFNPGAVYDYETKFPVKVSKTIPESVFVSTKEIQIQVIELDHELMLVNNDIRNIATWDDPTKYQKIERVTLENDPRRVTVRLLNFVVGVTGEGPLVPTQVQTWF